MLNFTIASLNPIPADATHGFALAGTMDAHCAGELQTLTQIEPGSRVILDFAQVVLINSMGLAQFLRLLNTWQSKGIGTEAVNLNRMTRVLFKMTGLNRYFSNLKEDAAMPENPAVSAIPAASGAAHAAQQPVDRWFFDICTQSVNQMNGWFLCNNYLQRKLGKNIRANVVPPANTFDVNSSEAHLVFAKPFEVCYLLRHRGYRPLVRPQDEAKEVVIVVKAQDSRTEWQDFANANVVTALRNSFVYLLGRYLCDESGLDSANLQFKFSGNDIKALMLLLRGQADMLLMSYKTYRELSELSRRDTRVLEISQTQFAYPMLCASPALQSQHELLRNTFAEMTGDAIGIDILKELDLPAWSLLAQEEIDMLTLLYDRYGTVL